MRGDDKAETCVDSTEAIIVLFAVPPREVVYVQKAYPVEDFAPHPEAKAMDERNGW